MCRYAALLMLCVVVMTGCDAGASRLGDQPGPQTTQPAGAERSGVQVYPAPMGEKLSEDYDLKVGGRKVPVYVCRVSAMPFDRGWPGHQRALDQTELAAFAYWDMAGPVDVEIASRRAVESVAVRPTARGIQPKVEKNHIAFRLPAPGPITVEVNGTHLALHLFPSPARPAGYGAIEAAGKLLPPVPDAPAPAAIVPAPASGPAVASAATAPASAATAPTTTAPALAAKGPDLRYFGPGIHRPGRIVLESNQTVYLAGGAVVYGSIQAQNASNIKILGRGILDASLQERGRGGGGGCMRLTNCQNVEVEGVILRDPEAWCFTLSSCAKVNITNLKLVGLWRYNSDGIDVCNCQDVAIRDTFIRSFDDSIVIKGLRGRGAGAAEPKSVQRVTAERCVLWNDWGRALEIGAETVAPEMTDITFRDCDVIHTDFAAMDIQHGDRAAIKNVLYENIRFEIDDVSYQGVFQRTEEQKYEPNTDWVPRLLVIEIVHNEWSRDTVQGTVEGVTLRHIRVTGKHRPTSRVGGFDAEHQVKGVTIEDLRFNGKAVKSLEEANVTVRPFAQDVRLVAP